jgi:hypothetical protein
MEAVFKEKQKFTQWWLWLFLIGIGIFQVYALSSQLIKGVYFGDKPMSNIGLIIFTIIPFGIIILFWYIKLETEIDEKEIRVKFTPLVKKTFRWENIKTATVIQYKFVGYGIRLFTSYGTVYNTKGNMGLAIELKNGEKFLIGTQKASELTKEIEKRLTDKL